MLYANRSQVFWFIIAPARCDRFGQRHRGVARAYDMITVKRRHTRCNTAGVNIQELIQRISRWASAACPMKRNRTARCFVYDGRTGEPGVAALGTSLPSLVAKAGWTTRPHHAGGAGAKKFA